jgi:Spy/CpxP family protein refolding chaperone
MKIHYVLGLAALLALPVAQAADTAPAQDKDLPCPMMMDGMEGKMGNLNLTDDQKAKLKPIFQDAMTKHRAVRDETDTKIKGVLTAEQYKKFEENRAERREQRKEHVKDRMKERKEHAQKNKGQMKDE